jgi:Fur family ferric uptake transcriptional regulator
MENKRVSMEKKRQTLAQGKIRKSGYRITSGRRVILDVLSEHHGHLSAEDVYNKVHECYPAIGLASVYRTLQMLVNVGLVFKFDFGDGRARYEVVECPLGQDHHHHFICTGCGRIINHSDFIEEELAFLKKVEEGLMKKYGFKITNHNLQFHGLCNHCKDE